MIIREKVIKGLECCRKPASCRDCPYPCYCEYADDWPKQLLTDALELLKKQEPKTILDIADSAVDGADIGRCPTCQKSIVSNKNEPTRFCRYCGQAVKWNA